MSLETQGKINEDPSGSFFFIQIHLSMLTLETEVNAGREVEFYKEKAPWIPQLTIYPGFKPVSYDSYRKIKLK